MSREKRVAFIGYVFVTSRGTGDRIVFKGEKDRNFFKDLLFSYSIQYDFQIHNYCLIGKEYFLLIQTFKSNLSKIMGQLNGNYARYYNKKYETSGHLWSARFNCWYISNMEYLPTVVRYIEQKPYELKLVKNIVSYRYSSYHYFLEPETIPEVLKSSWIVEKYLYNIDNIRLFFHTKIDYHVVQILKKESRILTREFKSIPNNKLDLKELFNFDMTKKERNVKILEAFKKGYSQHQIAKVLGLSQPAIHGIIKRESDK